MLSKAIAFAQELVDIVHTQLSYDLAWRSVQQRAVVCGGLIKRLNIFQRSISNPPLVVYHADKEVLLAVKRLKYKHQKVTALHINFRRRAFVGNVKSYGTV
jgi:hypothetical protein